VVALRAGVDDYIEKPCDPKELMARIAGLIERQRRALDTERRRGYTLAGDFTTLPFPDLVAILEVSRRTGSLSIATPRALGEIFLHDGRPVHAIFGNLTGPEAFYRVMAEVAGQFEFTTRPADACTSRTIGEPVTALVMEGARRLDDRLARGRRTSTRPSSPAKSVRLPASSTSPPLERPTPALGPTRALGAQFELGISDAFALGELQLFTHEELARWTRAPGGRDRLHVHLLAEPAAGVSALLAIAGQPTERWVVAALGHEPKTLGLSFFLRQERLLDIALLDVKNAAAFQRSLRRSPAVAILAPPNGDFLALGTTARLELEGFFKHLSPPVVLGVGNAALGPHVTELATAPATQAAAACKQGALGAVHTDLRALVVAGIRLWASSSNTSVEPPSAAERTKGRRG
jgi:hypothetical protein